MGNRFKNMEGKQIGNWIVSKRHEERKGFSYWFCQCVCGKEKWVIGTRLRNGQSKGCGCHRDASNHKNIKHGVIALSNGKHFYRKWRSMIQRCEDKDSTHYHSYGGRGIKVCDRWHNVENFRDDMYESFSESVAKFGLKETTLDRIYVNGDYKLKNCRWVTWAEQHKNKRPTSYLVYKNVLYGKYEFSRLFKVPRHKLKRNLSHKQVTELIMRTKSRTVNLAKKEIVDEVLLQGMTRNEKIKFLRNSGFSLQEVGNVFALTRERVRQLCL